MGGWNSGRSGGRPVADTALRVELLWMLRTGKAVVGHWRVGSLAWTCQGEPSGNISYSCDMRDPDNAWMELRFTVTTRSTGEKRDYVQRVRLSYTVPHFGGRRWWMHCPANGSRVVKLYCPRGADEFASREAWRLGYQSQRNSSSDKVFERLFRLQRKVGGEQGWGAGPGRRPKGMWHRTYERHFERYLELDSQCGLEGERMLGALRGKIGAQIK
jgi:hypothetical protein